MRPFLFSARSRRRAAGMSQTETLATAAGVCLMGGLAMQLVSGVWKSGTATACHRAVATLNASLAVYLENGGTIPENATHHEVLAKLKKRINVENEGTFAGVKGPFVDVRMVGTPVASADDSVRIVWDGEKRRFRTAMEGQGWTAVHYDESQAGVDHGTETREATYAFAHESRWVWDYTDTGAGRSGKGQEPSADPGVPQTQLSEMMAVLAAPVISPASGVFNHRDFPLTMTIRDANAPNLADLLYDMNGGGWFAWNGGEQAVPKALSTTVSAFARSRDSNYEDSGVVSRTWITYFMQGLTAGEFVSPSGDSRLEHALTAEGTELVWGKVESPGQNRSRLEIDSGEAFEAGPGESFEVGRVHFANGLTRAGTNAKTAVLRMRLNLNIPAAAPVMVELPVRMLSTVHYPWTPPEERLDYVWMPKSTQLQAVTVLDRQLRVRIHATAEGAVEDGDEIKVPVEENAAADIILTASIDALN